MLRLVSLKAMVKIAHGRTVPRPSDALIPHRCAPCQIFSSGPRTADSI